MFDKALKQRNDIPTSPGKATVWAGADSSKAFASEALNLNFLERVVIKTEFYNYFQTAA